MNKMAVSSNKQRNFKSKKQRVKRKLKNEEKVG